MANGVRQQSVASEVDPVSLAKRMAAHYSVTSLLAEAPTLSDAAPNILREIIETLNWEMGVLWNFDEEAQLMMREGYWTSSTRKPADLMQKEKSVTVSVGALMERVWIKGDPAWSDSIKASQYPLPPLSIKSDVPEAGCFPIKSRGHILGAMEFVGKDVRHPDANALEMVAVIGAQIGLYIERSRAREGMLECEARYRCLADADSDVLVTIDEDLNLMFVNKASEHVFGYAPDELLQKNLTLIVPEYLDRKAALEKDTRLDPTKRVEMSGKHKNGETIVLEVSFAEFIGKWKRISAGVLRDVTERNRTRNVLKETERKLQSVLAAGPTAHIVVESPPMLALLERVKKAAASEASIAIQGETGSGKECIAHLVHDQSRRASRPFVARNCAAIPAEIFESEMFGHRKGAFTGAVTERKGAFLEADGGTLFLDEIGDLEYNLQSKLLRAIQEKVIRPVGSDKDIPVDVRIVCATNKDLRESCKIKEFRDDLFYRLANVVLSVPPLRARRDDILPLARHFVALASKGTRTLTPAAEQRLLSYPWPGNVRELRSLMEQSVIFAIGNEIQPDELNLPGSSSAATSAESKSLVDVERRHILDVLKDCDGNKSEAALVLGLARSTLVLKLKGYPSAGVETSDARQE